MTHREKWVGNDVKPAGQWGSQRAHSKQPGRKILAITERDHGSRPGSSNFERWATYFLAAFFLAAGFLAGLAAAFLAGAFLAGAFFFGGIPLTSNQTSSVRPIRPH